MTQQIIRTIKVINKSKVGTGVKVVLSIAAICGLSVLVYKYVTDDSE